MSVVSGSFYGRDVPELPSVVRSVSSSAPMVPQQRGGLGGRTRPVAVRVVHSRDMSQPYTSYDPMLPVVVDVAGVRSEGLALGTSGELVHVGWTDVDGSRQLTWLPHEAVTFVESD
jgi:hypothetical protein